MITHFRYSYLAALFVALGFTQVVTAETQPSINTDAAFEHEFGEHFLEAYWVVNPDHAIYEGYYKNADLCQIPSNQTRANLNKFLTEWELKLNAYDANKLNSSNKSEWAVIDLDLRKSLWELNVLKEWEWNPSHYNVAGPISRLLESNYTTLDQRLRIIGKRLKATPAYYSAAEQCVKNPSRVHTQLAIDQNQGALKMLGQDLENKFKHSGLSALEQNEYIAALNQARVAVLGYITWLKNLDQSLGDTGARSFRLGAKLYNEKFSFENPDSLGAEALYAHALIEKEIVLGKMDALADTLWSKYLTDKDKPQDKLVKIAQIIDVVSRQHSAPRDYVQNLRVLMADLTRYVSSTHLVNLDPNLPLGVREMPVYERGISFGNAESPGPYDATTAGYFNIIPPDTYPTNKVESLLREYNTWTTQIFTIHEAIPGHLVQLQHANKSPSRIRSVFSNTTMIEGWAVFGERMMLESGWGNDTPELLLMYWKWYLRSVLNTIVDHGVHVGNMTETEVKALIVREGFQSEEEAAIKWRRAELSSVQLTCYFSGFSQIYDFRTKWKKQQGERYTPLNFNEEFLSYGSVPVGIIIDLMNSNHE